MYGLLINTIIQAALCVHCTACQAVALQYTSQFAMQCTMYAHHQTIALNMRGDSATLWHVRARPAEYPHDQLPPLVVSLNCAPSCQQVFTAAQSR